jgi:multidrug efflux pump subunit AcrB
MESATLQGVTITPIYFQPDVNIDLALSQVTASTHSIRTALPPCIQSPVVMQFSASPVPVIQLTISSQFVGLLPMAVGIGEGSEQNAALARAVPGGIGGRNSRW